MKVIAIVLAVTMAAAPAAQLPQRKSVKAQAILVPAGAPVQVKMVDERRLVGKMGAISDEWFILQTLTGDKLETRQVKWEEVAWLKAGAPKSGMQKFLQPALAVLGLLGTVGAVTAAIRR